MFKPLNGRIAVEQLEAEETTASGIIIPGIAKDKPSEGIIIAVAEDIDEELKVGDKILFAKYDGDKAVIDGKEIIILEDVEILGVFVE